MSEYDEVAAGWKEKAQKKSFPPEFIERLEASETVTETEKEKIVDSLRVASDIPIPKPPPKPVPSKAAPVISDAEKPDTVGVSGLALLRANEIPVAGQHKVVWGSAHLDDIWERPVRKTYPLTEDEHAEREIEHTKVLLRRGLKNPVTWTDPITGKPGVGSDFPGAEKWDRVRRTEHYARWRYKGYACGEISGL